jgi:hypothetical protein
VVRQVGLARDGRKSVTKEILKHPESSGPGKGPVAGHSQQTFEAAEQQRGTGGKEQKARQPDTRGGAHAHRIHDPVPTIRYASAQLVASPRTKRHNYWWLNN